MSDPATVRKVRQALLLAQVSTLAFGISLLVWGLTPVIVQRLTSRQPPTLDTLAASSVALLLGSTFVGLCVLIGRGVIWAMWATVLVSLMLLTGGLCVSLLGAGTVSMFPLLLATTAGLTSAFALTLRKAQEEQDSFARSDETPENA